MSETSWREFAALKAEPGAPPCPFCGINHKPAKSHPYCDMAGLFNFWLAVRQSAVKGAV